MNYVVSNSQKVDDIDYSFMVFWYNGERCFCYVETDILYKAECLCGLRHNNIESEKNQPINEINRNFKSFYKDFEVIIKEEDEVFDDEDNDEDDDNNYRIENLFDD